MHPNQIQTDRFCPTLPVQYTLGQQTDERSTEIDKKHMEINQNDQYPPNSISKWSKAIDNVHASKSDPDTKTVLKPNKESGRGTYNTNNIQHPGYRPVYANSGISTPGTDHR
jgi:hypothetical protein